MIWIGNARDTELTAQEAYKLTEAEKVYKDVIKEVFSYINKSIDCSIREWKRFSITVNSGELSKILQPHGLEFLVDRVMNDIKEKYKQLGFYIKPAKTSSLCEVKVFTISWSKRDLARLEKAA